MPVVHSVLATKMHHAYIAKSTGNTIVLYFMNNTILIKHVYLAFIFIS